MIRYYAGFKYVIAEAYIVQTPVVGETVDDDFFTLYPSGKLIIRKGFGWDGASGPTIDTKSSMSASAVHDVFCICMRDGRLSYDKWQDTINWFFKDMCLRAGMGKIRADVWHWGVEFGDAGNPAQGPDRLKLEAP